MRYLIPTILTLFILSNVNAQRYSLKDTTLAKSHLATGDGYFYKSKLDSANFFYKSAADIYFDLADQQNDPQLKKKYFGNYVTCSYYFAWNKKLQGKFKESLTILHKVLKTAIAELGEKSKQAADIYNGIGSVHQEKGTYDIALENGLKSLKIMESLFGKEHINLVGPYINIGNLYADMGDNNGGLMSYENAVLILEKDTSKNKEILAATYNNIGVILKEQGFYNNAIENYSKAIKVQRQLLGDKHTELASSFLNIGLLYKDKGDYDLALDYYQKALGIWLETIGEKNPNVAKTYHNIGTIYWYRDQAYNQALEYHNKALFIRQEVLEPNNSEIALSYNAMGKIYHEKEDFDRALDYILKAKNIWEKSLGVNHRFTTSAYSNLGIAYLEKGLYEEALKYNQKALKIRKSTLEKNHFDLIESYQYLGNIYERKGDYNAAIQSYENAISVGYKQLGDKNRFVTRNSNYLANLYLKIGNYEKSLKYSQKALYSAFPSLKDSVNIKAKPDLKVSFDEVYALAALQYKAKALSEIGDSNNNKLALSTYFLCDSIISMTRNNKRNYADKIDQSISSNIIYQEAIDLCFTLFKESGDDKYVNDAFYFSEKSKASVLNEGIANIKAKSFAGIPDSLLEKENELKIDLSFYKSQLLQLVTDKSNLDTVKVNRFAEKIFTLKRESEQLVKILESKYPKYFQLKYSNKPIKISEVQQILLDEGTLLLEYFKSVNDMYAFVIGKNEYKMIKLEVNNDIYENIKTINNDLISADIEKYQDKALAIYNSVFAPLEINAENLILIPDGILWHLNFDILLTQKPQKLDFRKFEYLIKKHNISYAHSANLLLSEKEFLSQHQENKCLAFSYDNSDGKETGDFIAMRGDQNATRIDLPGTRKEISAISEMMEGVYYYGSFASEANFKKNAKDYNILHLALHGETNDEKPMNSKLLFSKIKNNEESEDTEDNFLHAYELYNIQLNADLAVLSACKTGTGKVLNGEGVMSLGRAFSYSGCKSIVISHWDLSDHFTPGIIKDFYQKLKDGNTKSQSLRTAKLNYLKNSDNISANPYYWAPLVQLGDNAPLPQKNYMIWVIAGFVILAVLVSTRFVFRK